MDENPRITELRKKLEKDPGSRLFAQLAEELRKEGKFDDAIGVCRRGLEKNANYPSARLTLARALLDSGRPGQARPELEQIVKASPDNIMASRLLGDAFEDLGDLNRASQEFERALRLVPDDKALVDKLADLKTKLAPPSLPVPPPSPIALAPVEVPPSNPPIPSSAAYGTAETINLAPPPPASDLLDRDLASGTLSPGSLTVSEIMHFEAANATRPADPTESPRISAPDEEEQIEETLGFGQVQSALGGEGDQTGPSVPASSQTHAAPVTPQDDLDVGAQTLPLSSVTLADLYLQQGLKAEASAVLSQILKDEPQNAHAASRLADVTHQPETFDSAALVEPVVEDSAPSIPAWPTAPIAPLAQSALPASMRAVVPETLPAPLIEPLIRELPAPPPEPRAPRAEATPRARPRSRTEIKDASLLALNALLGAVEREAVQQRATERGSF